MNKHFQIHLDREDLVSRELKGVHAGLANGPLAERHSVRFIGAGDELVVFSHGFGTDQNAWAGVLDRLPPGLCAMVYDLPGAGPLLPHDYNPADYDSLASYADDLLALLDELNIHRCQYVGSSVSGMIGALAAVAAPDRFSKLVLLNASPRYLNDGGYVGGFSRADLDGLYEAIGGNYQAWVAGFVPMAVAADVPHAVEEFSAGFLKMRPDITVQVAKTIFESDLRHLLPQVHVPTVLIHCTRDIAVPPEVASYLLSNIPNSELVWIEAIGHVPHMTAPEQVARVLAEHLQYSRSSSA